MQPSAYLINLAHLAFYRHLMMETRSNTSLSLPASWLIIQATPQQQQRDPFRAVLCDTVISEFVFAQR